MNTNRDNTINNTTQTGSNIRVTARTKALAEKIQRSVSTATGVNKPVSAIVGELVFARAKELGVED